MREIISLQVGQCGNQVGYKFWETICEEHGVQTDGSYKGDNEMQLEHIRSYYNEAHPGKYIPRAVMVDLDPGSLNFIRSKPFGALFTSENFISGEGTAGNNYAKGHHTLGAQLVHNVLDSIHREVEACDSLQGFQLTHSLGGGTGSGLGALLLAKLREEYPDRVLSTFSVIPSPKVSDTVVEPYNAVLSIDQLIEHSKETFCIDNGALFDNCARALNKTTLTYGELNRLAALTMSGLTTTFRFPGYLNSDLRKLSLSTVPSPRLHFLMPGFAPTPTEQGACALSVKELAEQMVDAKNMLVAGDLKDGYFFTASAIFREGVASKKIEEQMHKKHNFVEWLPKKMTTSMCPVPQPGLPSSAIFFANSTAIQKTFERILKQFDAIFSRKAFLHWYTAEGMEEKEFEDARENVKTLVEEYQKHEDVASGEF